MKLTFDKPHLSIGSLSTTDIEFGTLTVITGLNGSGKSQLLQAINNGHVLSDIASIHNNEISLYDWLTFVPPDVGAIQSRSARASRVGLFNAVLPQIVGLNQAMSTARSSGMRMDGIVTAAGLMALSVNEIKSRLSDPNQAEVVWQNIRNARNADVANFRGHHPGGNAYPQLEPIAKALGKEVIDLTLKDVDQDVLVTSGMTPFQATFAPMFVDYRNLLLRNNLAQLREQKGETSARPISDMAFVEKYKQRPWEVLNKALAEARSDFVRVKRALARVAPGSIA